MQLISQRIHQEESLIGIEETVAKLEEIFRLQRAEELQRAEKIYLPTKQTKQGELP